MKKIFSSDLKNSEVCSFCNIFAESQIHTSSEWYIAISLWKQMTTYFNENPRLFRLTTQTAILGIFDETSNYMIIFNHLLPREGQGQKGPLPVLPL